MIALLLANLQVDPYLLEIGTPGRVKVEVNQVVDTRSGQPVSVEAVARAAEGARFVYLGESHNSPAHHQMQADVIEALAAAGHDVVVGFEQFTRPVQGSLNPWTLGWWDEATFIERADWKGQWGFDYGLYRPIFETVKRRKLPMVALNVPRDWVRSVGRGGYAALTAEQKKELPADLFLGNPNHRSVFTALMGGHPLTGAQGENVYSAQVLWDEGMADTALKYLDRMPGGTRATMVVIAGSGHVMYGQGINYRVHRRTGVRGITMTMIDGTEPREVSRGLGDFVYLSPPGPGD